MNIIEKLFRKLKHPFSLVQQERGQGLTEFILLLVLVVGIILGVVFQFNSSVRNFAENYFGNYISCLLESGEIPNLGARNSGTQGVCDASYEEFSFAEGRPPSDSQNSGGSAGGGSAGTENAGTQNRSENLGNTSSGGVSGTTVAGGGSRGVGEQGFRNNRFAVVGNQNSSTAGGASKKEAIYTGDTESTSASWAVNSSAASKKGKSGYNDYGEYLDGDPERQKEDRKAMLATTTSSSKNQSDSQKKRFVASQKKKTNNVEAEVEGFSFGEFIRYLIIAAILIAILLFFGSQVMQVSKSMD